MLQTYRHIDMPAASAGWNRNPMCLLRWLEFKPLPLQICAPTPIQAEAARRLTAQLAQQKVSASSITVLFHVPSTALVGIQMCATAPIQADDARQLKTELKKQQEVSDSNIPTYPYMYVCQRAL